MNVSMACNHCEDPVCLKGCPTLAYTKYVEYGAVLQDPNICFGCGYCTWVCPYNAPVLDPVKGEVQKCNMCIDRLEDGLQPSCVSACLSNALDFGIIDLLPKGKAQAKLEIPGFPDPAISRPNIRFEQKRSLPAQLMRADNDPFMLERDKTGPATNAKYKVKPINPKEPMGWGFDHLRSREDSLVFFTLLSQFVVGTFLLLFLLPKIIGLAAVPSFTESHSWLFSGTLFFLFAAQTVGMVISTLHLGKPRFFYRAINNLRHSPVSQEILTMGAFHQLLFCYFVVTTFPGMMSFLPDFLVQVSPELFGWTASGMGILGIFCMYRCYRIPARPFWNHWHTGGVFAASGLMLGSLTVGLLFGLADWWMGKLPGAVLSTLAWPLLLGTLLQGVSLFSHTRYLKEKGEEAAVSQMLMMSRFGKTTIFRTIGNAVLCLMATLFALGWFAGGTSAAGGASTAGGWGLFLWSVLLLHAVFHELIGRALFYVAVIPTTIPGAFFWGNKSFEAHARKTGLANMPQVGVVPGKH
jgi:DMSO reductase anchor subunit/ferredoxin